MLFRRRQAPSIASPWLTPASPNDPHDTLKGLYNLAVQIPELLSRIDKLCSSSSLEPSRLLDILQGFEKLDVAFGSWVQTYLSGRTIPAYRRSDDGTQASKSFKVFIDPMCQPDKPDARDLEFSDQSASGILARYWSLRLELLVGMHDVLQLLHISHDPDLQIMSETRIQYVDAEARTTAWMASQAIDHVSTCLEGRVAAQGPLDIVTRYYERFAEPADQKELPKTAAFV